MARRTVRRLARGRHEQTPVYAISLVALVLLGLVGVAMAAAVTLWIVYG